jgi:LemA protein
MGIATGMLFVFIAIFIFIYNSLIARKNQVDQNASTINTYLKKRAELIPELVSIANAYSQYEKNLITKLAELRAYKSYENQEIDQFIEKSDSLSISVKGLIATLEGYPNLKADKNFLDIQKIYLSLKTN